MPDGHEPINTCALFTLGLFRLASHRPNQVLMATKTEDGEKSRELEISADHHEDPGASPIDDAWRARERRLVRKLDMTLMPMIWVMYLFNYLDRNNIAYDKSPLALRHTLTDDLTRQAKLNDFEDDLGLVGEQFNVAVSILNVGYMLMQLPSNMILTLVRPSLYMPFWVCVWSVISAATAGVHNYRGLIAVRFCLGESVRLF